MKQAMTRPRLKGYVANPTKTSDPFQQRCERFPKSEGTVLKDEFGRTLEDADDFEGAEEFTDSRTVKTVTSARRNLIPQFLCDKSDVGGGS